MEHQESKKACDMVKISFLPRTCENCDTKTQNKHAICVSENAKYLRSVDFRVG